MKNKGFTLIELLAVIIILAIIALIVTPIILGIIDDSKEKSNEISIDNYAKAVENAVAKHQLKYGTPMIGTFKSNEKGTILTLNGGNENDKLKVEYDGAPVVCSEIQIYEDGSFYLAGCKIDNGTKEYTYGTKIVKPCTRQNDEEGFDTVTCIIGENTESFYVMNSYLENIPSDKILMLTKYNINVDTYRQDSTFPGTEIFSGTNYWSSITTYPAYVYNNNSVLYQIVNNYVSYLNGELTNATGSLLTHSQSEALGCSVSSCSNAPSWVNKTKKSYWTGSAYSAGEVFFVGNNEYYGYDPYDIQEKYGPAGHGVRPVITISTSDIG